MNYLEKNLSAGENIQYIARIHWFIFVRPLCLIIIGFFLYSASSKYVYVPGLLLVVSGIISLSRRLLMKTGSLYAVTNKRVVLKSGIIKRDALELLLQKCEGIRVNQGIWGRIFNYGTLLVTTGGATNTFRYISSPMKFRQMINDQL